MDKMKLITNFIYFYHLDKFLVIPEYPENISDNLSVSFTQTNALARTAPVFSYNNSGPRMVSVSLDLHRDMMNDINTNVSNIKDNVVDFTGDDYVDTMIKHLQAAAMPKYNVYAGGAKAVVPPMIAIRFGDDIFIKGVVNGSVSVTYNKPIMYNNKYASVKVAFQVYETDPYDVFGVLDQGSFRGITSTFRDGIYGTIVKSTITNPLATNVSGSTSVKASKPTTVTTTKTNSEPKKSTTTVAAKGGLVCALPAANPAVAPIKETWRNQTTNAKPAAKMIVDTSVK